MRVAVLQSSPQPDKKAALLRLDAEAARAARADATLLVTPEMFLTGYNIGRKAVLAASEPEGGELMQAVCKIAGSRRIAIATGLPIRSQGEAVFNAAMLADASGRTLAVHRKVHLYGLLDRSMFVAGSSLATPVALGALTVTMAVCYDIEFPEVARHAALSGADLVIVPTANMEPYTSVATRLVPARAEENGIYVAYANYCGSEGDLAYCGRSVIAGPSGEDVARAGVGEELLFADIDLAAIERARAAAPYLSDRRPGAYELSGPAR